MGHSNKPGGVSLRAQLILALILFSVLSIIYFRFEWKNRKDPLARGRIIYDDLSAAAKVEKPLFDHETKLVGRPDLLLKQGKNLIPIEVKSHLSANEPYQAHIVQLMAYCLLVERIYGNAPDYGILKYRNKDFLISYTIKRKNELSALMQRIRTDKNTDRVHRSHSEPNRCRGCGYRDICDEKLG